MNRPTSVMDGLLTPFPHLSGAVDVVAVRQPDGSIRASPFYVRFGKFQGLLRRREKVVKINVNGQDVPLHMYVGRTGEAYFMEPKEDDDGDGLNPGMSHMLQTAGYSSNDDAYGHLGTPTSGLPWYLGDRRLADSESEYLAPSTKAPSTEGGGEGGGGPASVGSPRVLEPAHPAPAADGLARRSLGFAPEKGGRPLAAAAPESKSVAALALEVDKRLSQEARDAAAGAAGETRVDIDLDGAGGGAGREKATIVWSADTALAFHKLVKASGLQALQNMELSLAGHLLVDGMPLDEARDCFNDHRVSRKQFLAPGAKVAQSPNLVCKVGANIFKWTEVAPAVLGLLAFGDIGENYIQSATTIASETEETSRKESEWKIWTWFSRYQTPKETSAAAEKGAPPPLEGAGPAAGEPAAAPAAGAHRRQPSTDATVVATESLDYVPSELPEREEQRVPRWQRSLTLGPEQLALLPLVEGQNVITYSCRSSLWGLQQCRAYVYLYPWDTKLVISDIDGTITKSDVLGQVFAAIGKDWTQSGITKLFTDIEANGYQFMYLSARSIGQASLTRDYLINLRQDGEALPPGPVIISPDGLLPSLYREVVLKRPHDFKIACLAEIRELFPEAWNPFYAGLGNRQTDELSYEAAGVPRGKILTINKKGEVSLAGLPNSPDKGLFKTLQGINSLVDQLFPPVRQASEAVDEAFSSFQYWAPPPTPPPGALPGDLL